MKVYSRLFEPDLTRQLVAGGILSGESQDSSITHPAPPGLLITQDGGVVDSSAFGLDCGYGTGYCLSLYIAADLPAFSIGSWHLKLPWKDPQFQWLQEPSGNVYPNNMYRFPGCAALSVPRDIVINHRRIVRRGHSLNGFLLGYSFESIPDTYRHGANIEASLVLVDEMGRVFPTPVQLWVDRSAKVNRKQTRPKPRWRVVENPDHAKGEPVQA